LEVKVKFKVEKIYRFTTEDGRDLGRFVETGSFHGFTHFRDPSHAGREIVVDGLAKDALSFVFSAAFEQEGECDVIKATDLVRKALEKPAEPKA